MENVVEYIFVGFMFSLLLYSSLMFMGELADRYYFAYNFKPNFIYDYILSSLAPEGRLDAFFMQSLSYNYSSFFGYYWSYENIKEILKIDDYPISIQISPSLKVFVDFIDGFLVINSFHAQFLKPCGQEAFIYVFSNGSLNHFVHLYLIDGFGKSKLSFKPELVVAFVKYGSLFGYGFYGEFEIFHMFIPPGVLYLSSFECEQGFYAIDGIAGSSSSRLVDSSGVSFYTRDFRNFTIFSGYLNISIFIRGFGSLCVSFGVCSYNFSNMIILGNASFPINSSEINEYFLTIPITKSFHGENMRLFIRFYSISDDTIYIYFGGWSYSSKFTLNCSIPIFSQSPLSNCLHTKFIWRLWFEEAANISSLHQFKPLCIVVSNFNGMFYVALIPELEISIGCIINGDATYRLLNINGYHLLCKLSLPLASDSIHQKITVIHEV
ncbi:MAG: hypothetical protein QW743_07810 [Candidatus Methanomethylicia archaeon]